MLCYYCLLFVVGEHSMPRTHQAQSGRSYRPASLPTFWAPSLGSPWTARTICRPRTGSSCTGSPASGRPVWCTACPPAWTCPRRPAWTSSRAGTLPACRSTAPACRWPYRARTRSRTPCRTWGRATGPPPRGAGRPPPPYHRAVECSTGCRHCLASWRVPGCRTLFWTSCCKA